MGAGEGGIHDPSHTYIFSFLKNLWVALSVLYSCKTRTENKDNSERFGRKGDVESVR